jgi:site-specific DNA recombinase
VALARVSSREQMEEGFSLEVQEEALYKHAQREGGEIVKLFRIAETASKKDQRKIFKEMIVFVKSKADRIDGMLFHKIDRATRNLFDYVELERLELDHDVDFISVSQPTDNTPTGRLLRRMLAILASFYTDQQSVDVRDGLRKRVESGLFVGLVPYGYRNVRINERGLIEKDETAAEKVKRVFDLYAYENCTIDKIVERMAKENIPYTDTQPDWPRSKVATILHDRAYIGEVKHKGQWHQGTHWAIVDRITWSRVQVLMGKKRTRTTN